MILTNLELKKRELEKENWKKNEKKVLTFISIFSSSNIDFLNKEMKYKLIVHDHLDSVVQSKTVKRKERDRVSE